MVGQEEIRKTVLLDEIARLEHKQKMKRPFEVGDRVRVYCSWRAYDGTYEGIVKAIDKKSAELLVNRESKPSAWELSESCSRLKKKAKAPATPPKPRMLAWVSPRGFISLHEFDRAPPSDSWMRAPWLDMPVEDGK